MATNLLDATRQFETTPVAEGRWLFAINSLTMGGAERVFACLVNEMAARGEGHRMTVALLDKEREVRRIDGAAIERLDCRFSLARSVLGLVSLVRRLRPSVTVAFLTRSNIAAIIAMKLLRKPVIISERVDTTAHFAKNRFAFAQRMMVRLLYPRADLIVAVSQGVADTLVRDFSVPRERIAVVYNPVDLAAIAHQATAEPALPVTREDVVAVGRFVPNKNFAMALEAWHRSGVSGRLILLGEGPLHDELRARADALGVGDRVITPGFVENPYAILARAGTFLMPSNAEGFPNALVEAMACGVPVVSTDCQAGPAEILGAAENRPGPGEVRECPGGLLVPVNDPAAMANAITRMRDPAFADRLVAAAFERVQDFSVSAFVDKFLNCIGACSTGATASVAMGPSVGATAQVAVTGLRGMPGVMGGIETHCEELLPRLARHAPELAIEVFGRRPYQPAGIAAYEGIKITALPAPTRQSIEAIVATGLGVLAARWHGARLVHIHAIGPGLMAPLARLLGCKVIVTHHGADYRREKWGAFAKRALRLGEAMSARFADKVICVAPSIRIDLVAAYPRMRDKFVYIPNGSPHLPPLDQPEDEFLASLGLEPGRYILNAARLVAEKGQDYLIEAHRRSQCDLPLVIAGASQHGSQYASAVLAQASDSVRLVGQLTRAQLGVLYRNAALFVLPSRHEGLPIAALEAIGSATPVLMSDIPANLDLGLPSAHYEKVGDVAAWARALSGDLERYSTGNLPRDASFNWDGIAQSTLAVYREVLGS